MVIEITNTTAYLPVRCRQSMKAEFWKYADWKYLWENIIWEIIINDMDYPLGKTCWSNQRVGCIIRNITQNLLKCLQGKSTRRWCVKKEKSTKSNRSICIVTEGVKNRRFNILKICCECQKDHLKSCGEKLDL